MGTMLLLVAATLLSILPLSVLGDEFIPRCGECWCAPDVDCPEYGEGLWQAFPDYWPGVLVGFNLVSKDVPVLENATGGPDCYPFAEAVGPQPNYPESSYSQCLRPGNATETVCAFKYNISEEDFCQGLDYEMITYESQQVAEQDGAIMKHSGACGVCSNANDIGVRMKTIDTIIDQTIFCVTTYSQNRDFLTLTGCFEQLGFTKDCATLWAHFGATNYALCAAPCIPVDGQPPLNGPEPTCPLSNCTNCSSSQFESDFNAIGGMYKSSYNSGFVDEIAYPCDVFTRILDHDPCIGTAGLAPTPAPTPEITSGALSISFLFLMISATTALAATAW